MSGKDKLVFLKEFLRHPLATSSLLPSSQKMAQVMAHAGEPENAEVTVELGPGNGSFTQEILKQVPKNGVFFTIEVNENFAKEMQKKFPEVETIFANALDLPKILKKKKISKVNRIVSGIPWASFDSKLQDELLNAVTSSLTPLGEFITITFVSGKNLPQGRKFQKKLKNRFEIVVTTPIIWTNIPPAVAYYCQGPK